MIRLPRHCARRSLRRSLLGIALVLHVAWVTLAAVPASTTIRLPSVSKAMPCANDNPFFSSSGLIVWMSLPLLAS